ncbi:DoxX family protein [Nocardioidaceae bacterium]|nr:DoxX family protein [Nocardioidaceae bacterium]
MNVVAWILSAVLALAFVAAGSIKILRSKEQLLEDPRFAWAEEFSRSLVTFIGVAEVLGALGLILPWALDIAPVLTPIAALGLAGTMAGALVTHARRNELKETALPTVVLGVLALVVAAIRFAQL